MAIQSLFYISQSVVIMREKDSPDSSIISQACYGEAVSVIDEGKEKWTKIQMKDDGYSGWIENKEKVLSSYPIDAFANSPSIIITTRLQAHIYSSADTERGPIMSLPFGSPLNVLNQENDRWIKIALLSGKKAFVQRGDTDLSDQPTKGLIEFSKKFLGLPYFWGGRSSLNGFDCSGFIQFLFKQKGIQLPRDSKDQHSWKGFKPVEISKMKQEDLIFFGRDENKIRHVGMYIGNNQFIHSTVAENQPWIRISNLSDKNWNGDPNNTYPLRSARRLN
ncbi:MAG: SH3 domain-containing C40 family peptidase [Parachlamydiales bacterium]|jgi:cell wall-associated NlpC family hydrolase